MNFVRLSISLFLAFGLVGCGSNLLGSSDSSGQVNLLGETGDEDKSIKNRVHARFSRVSSVSVEYAFHVLPMPMLAGADGRPCYINPETNETICPTPPEYRPRAVVRISGEGSAYQDGVVNIQEDRFRQSLTADFDLGIDGDRRCLLQAVSAIESELSLVISGAGSLLYNSANSGGGTIGSGDGSSGSGEVESQSSIAIWTGNNIYAHFDKLAKCAVAKIDPLPLPPTDPTLPVEPHPVERVDD